MLHVVRGDLISGQEFWAERWAAGEAMAVYHDAPGAGPLEPVAPFAALWPRRAAFWADVWDDGTAPDSIEGIDDGALRGVLDRVRTVRLYAGTGLDDQLGVAFWASYLPAVAAFAGDVELVQFLTADGGRRTYPVTDLGAVPDDGWAGAPDPIPVTPAAGADLRAAWAAASAADPRDLPRFLESAPDGWPGAGRLRDALRHLLDRFPSIENGLPAWDERLLWLTEEVGPKGVKIVGRALPTPGDTLDEPGDIWLRSRLRRMASPALPRPLLRTWPRPEPWGIPDYALTDAGRAVLEGRADAVRLNGIDDWAGGVRLSSTGRDPVWRRDGGGLRRA